MENIGSPKESKLSVLAQLKAAHEQYLTELNDKMEQEATIVLDNQKLEGDKFREEVKEEIKEIKTRMQSLRKKFEDIYDSSPSKSFLKSGLK